MDNLNEKNILLEIYKTHVQTAENANFLHDINFCTYNKLKDAKKLSKIFENSMEK